MDQKLTGRMDELEGKLDEAEKNLAKRIDKVEGRLDKIGKQLAYLEDATPTREEHDQLEKRVSKLEQTITPLL